MKHPVSLSNTTLISGTVDVMKDGSVQWSNVSAAIMIQNNNVVSIALDSKATSDHFAGQPIYGITTSLTNAQGTQMIQGATTSASNIGQTITQGASNLGSKASSALSNLSSSVQHAFNKTK